MSLGTATLKFWHFLGLVYKVGYSCPTAVKGAVICKEKLFLQILAFLMKHRDTLFSNHSQVLEISAY